MEENKNNNSKKGKIAEALLFVFSVAVVVVIAIIEFGGNQDRHLEDVQFNFAYLPAAFGCFGVALICETLKYTLMLKSNGYASNAKLGFTTAVIGKYYDNITPAGAGGQGFQMYHLKKGGCDNGTSGSLPILGFLGLQFSFVFIGIVVMLFGGHFISDELLAVRITAIVGLVFYAFIPVCIVFFAIIPKPLEKFVTKCVKILHKIHIIKNPEKSIDSAIGSLKSYTESLNAYSKKPYMILLIFLLSLIYQTAFMAMPYFVLHFFGSNISFLACFCSVVYIYAACSVVFTPGNAGAAETSFYLVFSSLKGGTVFWAMLLWRLLCFYSWIIGGAIIQLRNHYVHKKKGL